MTYKIIKVSANDDSIVTTVVYDLEGSILETDVVHFRPSSVDDIVNGIKNRALSEKSKIVSTNVCKGVVELVELDKEVEI